MKTLNDLKKLIAYWAPRAESAQRTKVLAYLVKQVQKFIKYSRYNDYGVLIENTGEEVKAATKVIATFFKVPQRKKGENRDSSMYRLTGL